ncbi:MAG: hypothetical protein U9N46_03965 [Euryarchaeota archaeon]|nr:hypothetical protein [Euryarchaeota archaeon]
MITFNYRREKSEITGDILRPVASIEFKSKDGVWIELRPYIDSGADITLIPLTFGRLLGLELRKEEIKHLRGVGGAGVPVVITEVDTRINNAEFPVRVAWALEEDLPPLLGRTDIFDRFVVTTHPH